MPRPPLVQSSAAQRLLITLAMAILFAASLAAAYALSIPPQHVIQNLGSDNPIRLANRWQPAEAGPWRVIWPFAEVLRDTRRASRILVISPVSYQRSVTAREVAEAFAQLFVAGPTQSTAVVVTLDKNRTAYELVLLEKDGQVRVQHLFAVVPLQQDGRRHAVVYLRDQVESQAVFADNRQFLRKLYLSIHFSDEPQDP